MKRRVMNVTLKLPEPVALRIEAMAKEREMKMGPLLSDLIQVGMMDLTKNPPQLEAGNRDGEVRGVRR